MTKHVITIDLDDDSESDDLVELEALLGEANFAYRIGERREGDAALVVTALAYWVFEHAADKRAVRAGELAVEGRRALEAYAQ